MKMRSHHSEYKFKRIFIHFFRPLIENCVFISGFQRANLFRLIGYKNIGKEVFLGCNAIVCNGVKIGKNCIVGAGSVVTKNLEENSVYAGVPAKKVGEHIL